MANICKICGEKVESDRHFYSKHKTSAADYYIKFFPRKDLWSKDQIPFKNKIQYFETYFNSYSNMLKWINQVDPSKFKQFLSILIQARQRRKALNKPLCEVELQSLNTFPSLPIILKKISLKEYFRIYEGLGIKGGGFTDYSLKGFPEKDLEIGIDTRENKPFTFEKSRPFKLDYGDYTALGDDFDNVFVDRKAWPDFVSTFGGNIERFQNEIDRAKSFDAYLVVLVEETIPILKIGRSRLYNHTKFSPEAIFHNIRELIQNNENIQFLFTKSRAEARRCLPKILSYGIRVKEIDLQYLYGGEKL